MKRLQLLITGISFFFASCHHADEPPPPPPPPPPAAVVELTAVDTGLVDAQVRLKISNVETPYSVAIVRDGQTIFSSLQSLTDTTVLDTALMPRHTYIYKAYAIANGTAKDSSAPLFLMTLDTTSHEISWQRYYFGDGSSSILKDVCIINDTCVYAVGEIWRKDSLGNVIFPPYNLAKWNGSEWKLDIVYYEYMGQQLAEPLRSIYAFGENDIWVGGAIPYHWNGVSWTFYDVGGIMGGNTNKIFGISSNDLYIVGTSGSIAHYNGSSWSKIESGTTLDIQDIWGAKNRITAQWEILAAAGNHFISNERKLLNIKGMVVTSLSDSGIDWALGSIWFLPGRQYWVAGSGVWKKDRTLNSPIWTGGPNQVTIYTTNRIRGTDVNDIFICGAFGDAVHWNGSSWRSYQDQLAVSDGAHYSVAVTNDLIVLAGEDNPRAVIAMGTRHSLGWKEGRTGKH